MKRMLVLLLLVMLVGCSSEDVLVKEIEINLRLDSSGDVQDDVYTSFSQYMVTDTVWVIDSYDIFEIELLSTGFGEFPYESDFITNDLNDYGVVIQELFDKLADETYVKSAVLVMLMPKAKLIITMNNETSTIDLEFYQNADGELIYLKVVYTNAFDIEYIKEYRSGYENIFLQFDNLINEK
ncbi:MAG: hypothetical protein QM489_02940 [Candidatus Izemoplasma sp.]